MREKDRSDPSDLTDQTDPMKKPNAPHIAIALDLPFRQAAEVFSGVSTFVQERRLDWRLIPLNVGFETELIQLADSGKIDGVIGTFVSDPWVKDLLTRPLKAVNLFSFSPIESVPNVRINERGLGRQAFEHLRQQGARRYVYHGPQQLYASRLRCDHFRTALGSRPFCELPLLPTPSPVRLLETLKGEGPTGVFCSSDRTARDLIVRVRLAGLVLGKDVLVVGVNDSPTESVFAGVGISSFRLPVRESGHAAAAVLHAELEGGATTSPTLSDPIFIPRESSLATTRSRTAHRARGLLLKRLADPKLHVDQLAQDCAISRRALELAFNDEFKTSPYKMISTEREQIARDLLRAGSLPVQEVGRRIGYPEPHHFSAWFKQRTGQAPSHFRAAKT